MAFSLRKIISNISYFTKSVESDHETDVLNDVPAEKQRQNYFSSIPSSENIEFDQVEADSTSKCVSLNLTEPVRHYSTKKGSLSDTDLLTNNIDKQEKKRCRKLKLDIKKANQSVSDSLIYSENSSLNVENTPKHKLLDCKSAELFRGFNFNQSFDLSDAESNVSSYEEENIDIESISDHSDTDISIATNIEDKSAIKMCRKVDPKAGIAAISSESFADVEVDKNEEERMTLLLNYLMKFEKMECFLKKLLTEFQFHIEITKIFNNKSIVTTLPSTGDNISKSLGEVMFVDLQRGISPAWNIIMEKEDSNTKSKLKTMLLSMRHTIDNFIGTCLHEPKTHQIKRKVSNKKKIKYFDFPDLRDAMLHLFEEDFNSSSSDLDCSCHCHSSDSGLITKSEKEANHSITSSIGNFSLDSTTLSAYSESLDQVISYNSFNDTSLYSTLLQRAAIERITFYIQVHSIQLKSESPKDSESKSAITFHCPACNITEYEENGLLKHILSQSHGEKIHFIYKTAYVKKCIGAGKEIQPSTVLNPMTMYRDDNKIVCFGDALYACSLCFENLIVGESVLMAHCSDNEHIDRRERLSEMYE